MYKIKTHAKLNLFLHVNGKNNNSYHQLESLVVFCRDIFDEMTISESSGLRITCSGLYAPQIENNILIKTLKIFEDSISKNNFEVSLQKNIPIGAGLGGGSSNAAGLIRFLESHNDFTLKKDKLQNKMLKIGADVPVCYFNQSCYFNNLGEIITRVSNLPKFWAVVIFPGSPLITKNIFEAGLKNYTSKIEKKLKFDSYPELLAFLSVQKNDLYDNALAASPQLSEYIENLKQQEGCNIARMTGSGSAIFGLFKEKKKAINAIARLKERYKVYIKLTELY